MGLEGLGDNVMDKDAFIFFGGIGLCIFFILRFGGIGSQFSIWLKTPNPNILQMLTSKPYMPRNTTSYQIL